MDTQYAIVENDEVTNVINWDGEEPYTPAEGQELLELVDGVFVGVGWTRIDGVWTPPEGSVE